MSMFRSFISAQSNLTAQARRAFSTTLYGGANKNACINPEMLYLQPRWHVKKDQASTQGAGKVLVGMIQKRWNSASAQPVELVSCFVHFLLPLSFPDRFCFTQADTHTLLFFFEPRIGK